MKSFFKYVLATVVGIILSSVILFFITLGIVSAIVSSQEKTVEVKSNTILVLKLDQPIVDRKPNLPFDISTFSRTSSVGLNDILANIRKAKSDPKIKGIYLEATYIQAGIGSIREIREALLDFKTSGKFITAYSETYSQGAYYLVTAADEVFLNPVGFMEWVGLKAQSAFFKNALKKLDVEPTVIRHGRYKSAGEQFSETGFSPENRKQLQKLISSFWDEILSEIGEQRGIVPAKLNAIADGLLVKNPETAYELGLVDSLIYKDQLIAMLKEKTGTPENKDLLTVSHNEYRTVPEEKNYKGLAKDKIAVVYASGQIMAGEADDENVGSERFARSIRKARKDSTIKAIVVRINSPGGSAIASDVIWRELKLAREVKPVVVSMGDLAASGGYYIACMADTIYAQPTTITGSIGVIGMHINAKQLFNKYGVTFDIEKTNTYADFLSGVRPASEFELNYWQGMVDNFYKTFVSRVEEGRGLSYDEVDAIGEGRIWSGTDAIEIGLVDKLGGLQDAVNTARQMADLDEKYRIVELPKQEDPLEKLVRELTQNTMYKSLQRKLGVDGEYFSSLRFMLENQGILARMPYDISIQ